MKRLLNGQSPFVSLDDREAQRMSPISRLTAFVDDGGTDEGGGASGDEGNPGNDSDVSEDVDITGDSIDVDKFKSVVADRRRANAEAKAEKEARTKLEKELATYKKKEEEERIAKLDAEQQAQEKARVAEEKLAQALEASAHKDRMLEVTKAGVAQGYTDIVAQNLKQAQAQDPELDVTAWMAAQRESMPALFADATPAVPTAGGPPRSGGNSEIATTKKQLETAKPEDRLWLHKKLVRLEKAAT